MQIAFPLPVIGITGRFCSGKSTIAEKFELAGWFRIDVDSLGHQSIEIKKAEIAEAFGEEAILDPDTNRISREKLGAIVFADASKLKILEDIIHPIMSLRVEQIISELNEGSKHAGQAKISEYKGIIVDAALLYQMQLDSLCDLVFWVRTPLLMRIMRARFKRGLSMKRIFQLIYSQKCSFAKSKISHADMLPVTNIFLARTIRCIGKKLELVRKQYHGTK